MRNRVRWFVVLLSLGLLMGSVPLRGADVGGLPTVAVKLDGADVKGDVPAVILEGRTLLPVRALAEALGLNVQWDGDTRTVLLARDQSFQPHMGSASSPSPGALMTVLSVSTGTDSSTASDGTVTSSLSIEALALVRNNGTQPLDLSSLRVSLRGDGMADVSAQVSPVATASDKGVTTIPPGAQAQVKLSFTKLRLPVGNQTLQLIAGGGGQPESLIIIITINCGKNCTITITIKL